MKKEITCRGWEKDAYSAALILTERRQRRVEEDLKIETLKPWMGGVRVSQEVIRREVCLNK